MQDGFATKSTREEDYKKMEAAMTAKMEEGFRNEEQARQQTQKEIMAGPKNAANARQMLQNDLQAIKDEIRQLELSRGSGSDVSTAVGSGAFARPPQGMAVRLNELLLPRRLEFKGWVTDHKQCRYQGLTDTEVSILTSDLHKMVPDIDWEQTKNEQGTWPTQIMVSLWSRNEANLLTRIGPIR